LVLERPSCAPLSRSLSFTRSPTLKHALSPARARINTHTRTTHTHTHTRHTHTHQMEALVSGWREAEEASTEAQRDLVLKDPAYKASPMLSVWLSIDPFDARRRALLPLQVPVSVSASASPAAGARHARIRLPSHPYRSLPQMHRVGNNQLPTYGDNACVYKHTRMHLSTNTHIHPWYTHLHKILYACVQLCV